MKKHNPFVSFSFVVCVAAVVCLLLGMCFSACTNAEQAALEREAAALNDRVSQYEDVILTAGRLDAVNSRLNREVALIGELKGRPKLFSFDDLMVTIPNDVLLSELIVKKSSFSYCVYVRNQAQLSDVTSSLTYVFDIDIIDFLRDGERSSAAGSAYFISFDPLLEGLAPASEQAPFDPLAAISPREDENKRPYTLNYKKSFKVHREGGESETDYLKRLIAAKKKQLAHWERLSRKLPQLKESLASKQSTLEKLKAILPTSLNHDNESLKLKTMVHKAGLTVLTIHHEKTLNRALYGEIVYYIHLRGRASQLETFVGDLHDSRRIYRLHEIYISEAGDAAGKNDIRRHMLDARLFIKTYVSRVKEKSRRPKRKKGR